MLTFLLILHVVFIVMIIILVLLQAGKGAEIGAVFGGPSTQTLFGGAGASTIITRITTILIFLFMITSLGIAYLSSKESGRTLMELKRPSPQEGVTAPTTTPVEPWEGKAKPEGTSPTTAPR